MAAPASKTIKNLDGKWIIVQHPFLIFYLQFDDADKKLSDPTDPVLALQGIGWMLRKTIGLATVTQHLKTSVSDSGVTHITIEQMASGGIKGTTEEREFDWTYRDHSDWLFGNLKGKTRYNTLEKVLEENKGKGDIEEDAKFICEGWLPETTEGDVVESYVDNQENGWTGWQIWGFAEINGDRYFTRRFAIRKGKEVVRVRLVYEWAGEL